ncbi:hypothetical protein N1851_023025 [Merluccius polli]|uniref:Uncharacterized protein n=1 Tax=Merluccius polli TaxID=89951 RepID=A0AA47NXZ5_MERPO|nr:hypothetical protein N1851_023025 [Merluccius polli]
MSLRLSGSAAEWQHLNMVARGDLLVLSVTVLFQCGDIPTSKQPIKLSGDTTKQEQPIKLSGDTTKQETSCHLIGGGRWQRLKFLYLAADTSTSSRLYISTAGSGNRDRRQANEGPEGRSGDRSQGQAGSGNRDRRQAIEEPEERGGDRSRGQAGSGNRDRRQANEEPEGRGGDHSRGQAGSGNRDRRQEKYWRDLHERTAKNNLAPAQMAASAIPRAPLADSEEQMQLGRMHLSAEEWQRRLMEGRCFYCGSQAVLVDSGADANFMDRGLAEKLKLDLSPLPKPWPAMVWAVGKGLLASSGEKILSGIVPEDEGDTDAGERSQMDSVPNASSPSCTSVLSDPGANALASDSNAPASDSPAPASSDHTTPPGSVRGSVRSPVPTARVLSDAVLQSQREIIEAIGNLTAEVYIEGPLRTYPGTSNET